MEFFLTTELPVPLLQVIALLTLVTAGLLLGRTKLAQLITYLFTLYLAYILHADLFNSLHVTIRRDDDAITAHDRFHEQGGHSLGRLVLDDLCHMLRTLKPTSGIFQPERAAVAVGIQDMNHSG